MVVSPRTAMRDLDRDARAAQKGVAATLVFGVPLTLVQLVLWWQGYPPTEFVFGSYGLQVVVTVPLVLLGFALATFFIGLAIPGEYDRRWEPIFGRLGLTSVTVAGAVFISTGTMVVLGLGMTDAQTFWSESSAIYWAELVLSLWSFALVAIAVQVSTHRRWLVALPLAVGLMFVMALPYVPFWLLG